MPDGGVVRSDCTLCLVSDLVMENVLRLPGPTLRGTVGRYNGFEYSGSRGGTHHGLPSRYLTLVISWLRPIEFVDDADSAVPAGSFVALAGGLHTRPVVMRDHGEACGVMVQLSPLGARRLLGVPAGELAGGVVDLEQLWGQRAGELCDRLVSATSWGARFGVLDDVLGRMAADDGDVRRDVAQVWHRLVRSGGTVTVDALAKEVGWSRRYLSQLFRGEIGLGVKEAARMLRFERASTMFEQHPTAAVAAVAATCGYYDQAHMANEWRSLAGMSISAWRALELRDPPIGTLAV